MSSMTRRSFLALAGLGVLAAGGATYLHLSDPYRPGRRSPRGQLTVNRAARGTHRFGDHALSLRTDGMRLVDDAGRLVWASDHTFLLAAIGRLVAEEAVGHITVDEEIERHLTTQRVVRATTKDDECVLEGTLGERAWRLQLRSNGTRLHVTADVPGSDLVVLRSELRAPEGVHGLGEQFTDFDLRGRVVPVLTREQGVGRGREPLTTLAEITNGAGGSPTSTYAALPFAALDRRALAVRSDRVQVWDTREDTLDVRHWGETLTATWYAADSPSELLRAHTADTGRMAPLPTWTGAGAVLGLQGGTAEVQRKLDALAEADVAAVWLQDWVGQRTTSFGERLWWSWQLDTERYPGWDELVRDLHGRRIRVLGYLNCFLVDPADKPNPPRRNLYTEARSAGYLVGHPDGGPYLLDQGGFEAALLDLTHPRARAWFVETVGSHLAECGFDGWMADFGEALPFDAVLHGDDELGSDPAVWHNRWPTAWAELNQELVRRVGLEDEALVFHRSAGRGTAAAAGAFWAGDQLTTFDAHDGMASALRGMLAGGVSGMTLTHSDTGGYTGLAQPVIGVRRERELLLRWAEMNAWTPLLRTHEGNQPDRFAQAWDSGVRRPFAEQTRIFAALADYRREVVTEAASTGIPALRHGWLTHPGTRAAGTDDQFFFGERFLVVPVLHAGRTDTEAVLPPGRWVHLWSGDVHDGDATVTVPAPLGRLGVFHREGDGEAARDAERVRAAVSGCGPCLRRRCARGPGPAPSR